MSLVINSNDQASWFLVSNQPIWMSPDFQNSALFFVDGNISTTRWHTVSSNPIVASINWTPINNWCSEVIVPDYFTWVNWTDAGSWAFAQHWYQTSNGSNARRFAIKQQLQWWEIVWKNVLFPVPKRICVWWNNIVVPFCRLNYIVELLHSDWTITQVATTFHDLTTNAFSYVFWVWYYIVDWQWTSSLWRITWVASVWWTELISWPWFVAQAWDYLCLNLELTFRANYSDSSYDGGVWFWYKYTNNDMYRYRPVEVSLD